MVTLSGAVIGFSDRFGIPTEPVCSSLKIEMCVKRVHPLQRTTDKSTVDSRALGMAGRL